MATVGIDLGTSSSAAAAIIDGKIRLIPPSDGPIGLGNFFPSVVAFKEDGEVLVGKKAELYSYEHPDRVVRWIKRRMGEKQKIVIGGQRYLPQEISAMILSKIRRDAERFLGGKVEQAVITAPAHFNNDQRSATKEAGELAGLEVLRIISEPTAASLAYGLDKVGEQLRVAVLNLGAGTFDVSMLEMSQRVFKVISTSGDVELGGKDMDDRILNYLVEKLTREQRVNLSDEASVSRLRDLAEKAKISLSTSFATTINFQENGDKSGFAVVLTREELEELVRPIIARLDWPIAQALRDAGLSAHEVDRLVLVGGPTRMPIVWGHVRDLFGIEPERGFHPKESVAVGACIHGCVLSGEVRRLLLMDVTPLSLGVETAGGVFTRLIKRNTAIPAEASMVFATEEDYQTSMLIHVLQGERAMAYDNLSLGLFRLEGISPARRYEQEVKVIFRVDVNGILNVAAEVLATGRRQELTVEAMRLTEDEVAGKMLEASRFEGEDGEEKRFAEAQNRVRAVLYALKQSRTVVGGELSEEEENKLSGLLKKLRGALSCSDVGEVEVVLSCLREFMDGVEARIKGVRHVRMLASFVKKDFGGQLSKAERAMLDARVAGLAGASLGEVEAEIDRLRELLVLKASLRSG